MTDPVCSEHALRQRKLGPQPALPPVIGLVFLCHAYSRYLAVKAEIEQTLLSRGGRTRPLTK